MKPIIIIIFSLFLTVESFGQNKIYLFNKTGRPVWIQNTTILGVGSFPYVLDTTEKRIQYIPIDTKSPAILNVVIIPAKGPYGSADGIYYLFKQNDTVIVKQNSKNRPLVTHINSGERTKELTFILKLMDHLAVTPFYSLIKTNPQLYKVAMKSGLEKRDKIIDSLSRPYINSVESFCVIENIDPEIGKLYRRHYIGNMISDKLLLDYPIDSVFRYQIDSYYKDSIIKWSKEMDCEDCENVPFYNLALGGIYKAKFNGIDELSYLDTVAASTKGYAKSFLLSNYTVDRIESTDNSKRLLSHYDSLCSDTLYKRLVHDNYALHQTQAKLQASELAILMEADKSHVGFNQLLTKLRGNIIYIDFWASWCKPCVQQIPFSHSLKEKLAGKNIRMLYISLDTDLDSWRKACERFKINDDNSFVLVNPEKNKLAQKINLGPIPRYIVIDKKGEIVRLDASRPSDQETYDMLVKLAYKQ
jgi:thiol-disulfide isomerase/thioredoxin